MMSASDRAGGVSATWAAAVFDSTGAGMTTARRGAVVVNATSTTLDAVSAAATNAPLSSSCCRHA